MTTTTCPYLGLASDRTVSRTQPDAAHRCLAQTPPGSPDRGHQAAFCLAGGHASCPFYTRPRASSPRPPAPSPRPLAWLRYLPWLALVFLVIAVGVVYGGDLLRPVPGPQPPTPNPRLLVTSPQPPTASPQPPSPTPQPPTPTATLEPRGQLLTLSPRAGDAGWWTSVEPRGNHLGDSFLYAGYLGGQAFLSAARFEVARIPRGAPIREATLRLTGLNADRFQPDAGGTWQVQLLAADAVKDFARADFQALYNAPPSITLFPALPAADLGVHRVQELRLDGAARAWLAEQAAQGAASVIARITGPGSGDTLFAWDSGAGPSSGGNPPQLALVLGPPPATPPPLPTQAVIVATYTPTPANVLTVAADRLTATSQARAGVTLPSISIRVVTPTPPPANMATAQVLRMAQGLPPVVVYTATPANAATATSDAAYATAVAVTTGTFTPVPTGAVTPLVILPTPLPGNLATAVAQLLSATRQAVQVGAATPLPFNAVIATVTPSPFVVTNTPFPANYGTAVAQAAYATAVAWATGTFTPLPPNALTATTQPLLVYVTPRPPSTPTPTPPGRMPAVFFGKILFWSDRDGAPGLYALDPANGAVFMVTQSWPFPLAVQSEPLTRDGRFRAFVRNAGTEVRDNITGLVNTVSSPQIFVEDREYHTERQLTTGRSWSYDPVWSPRGDRIAYVSTEPGNDEIFTIGPDGAEPRRLTYNSWEWDKHPTWSPDGQQIVFYSNRDTGRRQLWIMNADGNNQRLLHDSLYNDWDPVWVK